MKDKKDKSDCNLNIRIPLKLREDLKKVAAKKYITVTAFVISVLAEAVNKELDK